MEKITNYNCEGMCIQAYCSEKYTHFCVRKINNMLLHLPMCKKHAEEFSNDGKHSEIERNEYNLERSMKNQSPL